MTARTPESVLLKRFLPPTGAVVVLGNVPLGLATAWAGNPGAGNPGAGNPGTGSSGAGAERQTLTAPADAALDGWAAAAGLRHIDWLLIHGVGRGALKAVESARDLLALHRIDFIQFDQQEAGNDLPTLYRILQGYGYSLFRFADRNLEFRREAPPADDRPCTHLAVAPRHWQRLFTQDREMFRYGALFARHGVVPRGIIHVGAHEGEEYDNYCEAGCGRVVFIEADPDTFDRLAARFAHNPQVRCIHRAVADKTGPATFTRMTGSQSSSLLRPKEHLTLYPHITLAESFAVTTAPLSDILVAHHIDPADYNVLAIDTQGAERLILAGCGPLLDRFDAVITEVNYAELYEGCGRIADIDDILFAHGYARVEEISPHHHSWGDAFYVRG